MKLKILLVFLLTPIFSFSQPDFNTYFKAGALRFDFLLGGNHENVVVYPEQIKKETHWGGNKKNLVDYFNYGSYRVRVFDLKSDSLIFSRGFSTLFQEWQTTAEAKEISRTFYQAAVFPFPRKEIRLEIDARQWEGDFKSIYQVEIDPSDYFIIDENPVKYKTVKILDNGNPGNKVDLAVLAEGYTAGEMGKFVKDAERMVGYLFDEPPFKENKDKFNVYAVQAPSEESGTDIPGEWIYKNTAFNSTFYTFGLPRYLTTSDMKNIYDAASAVPYDQIYILVNSERYGGGGFYNFVTVCTADNERTPNVFIHEFGHGFAGLSDEYYNSAVAYEDFYNLEIELWEPNLTTLTDFSNKWGSMIHDSIPVPTPRKIKYRNNVGVFEGGGYMAKGIYSPMMDCRMKSNEAPGFCPVCRKAIQDVIDFYTE